MTDEQINIAIAEACGWQFIPEHCHGEGQPPEFTTVTPDGKHLCGYYPNYCNDLNAMHEAESTLTDRQREVYADIADRLPITKYGYEIPSDDAYIGYIEIPPSEAFDLIHLSARQRAEAFLRTVGKWEETK